jgi:DNA-directed RNA polymerase beta' subunit
MFRQVVRPTSNQEYLSYYNHCPITIDKNLDSPLLGISRENYCPCGTLEDCPYHVGAIKLIHPIIHPLFEKIFLEKFINYCYTCNLFNNSHECKSEYCKLFSNAFLVKSNTEYYITPLKKSTLYKVQINTLLITKIAAISKQLESLIILYIPIIGPSLRKDFPRSDFIKKIYSDILSTSKIPLSEKYQATISSLYELLITGKSSINKKESPLSLLSILSSKEGFLRDMCLGKRVNRCMRSVIVPDPFLPLDTIALPKKFIELLQLPSTTTYKYFMYNRQPTLHKHSILGVEAICYEKQQVNVIYQNPLINLPFNADFDGDEMNCFYIGNDYNIIKNLHVKNALVNNNNNITFQLVQDVQTGIYTLSKKHEISSLLFQRCIGYNEEAQKRLSPPYDTTKLLSIAFPSTFSYKDIIINGIVKKGLFDNDIVNKNKDSLLKALAWFYRNTPEYFIYTLNTIQKIVLTYYQYHVLTIPIKELFCTEDELLIKNKYCYKAKYINKDICENFNSSEEYLQQCMEMIRGKINETIKQRKESNYLENIIYSGGKGSIDNITQIRIMMCQQIVRGKRPDPVYYNKEINDPGSRGMCYNSLTEGLTPAEFFAHAQSAREKIAIQGNETPITGYAQRKLIKFLENIKIGEYNIIRNNNNEIIQLDFPLNGSKIYTEKDPFNIDELIQKTLSF